MVAISVPGQSGLARFVKLPPVEEKKIADIVQFEAKQQIPFPSTRSSGTTRRSAPATVTDGFAMETEIGLFAMKRDMVNRYLQHFKDVDVEVHVVQMAPLALCNFVAYDLLEQGRPGGSRRGRAKPARSTASSPSTSAPTARNLVITDGEQDHLAAADPAGRQPLHPRPDQGPEAHLRQGRAPQAQRRQVARPQEDPAPRSSRCSTTSSARCSGRSATSPTRTATPRSSTWSAWATPSACPACRSSSQEKLQLEVRKLGKMERADRRRASSTAPMFTENILSFAVAYGLALQGLKQTAAADEPAAQRDPRRAAGPRPRSRGPSPRPRCSWSASAASASPPGSTVYPTPPIQWRRRRRPRRPPPTRPGPTRRRSPPRRPPPWTRKRRCAASSPARPSRKDWLEFTHYLFTDALPHPDGSNLSDSAHKQYWDKGRRRGLRRNGEPPEGQGYRGSAARCTPPIEVGPGVKPPEAPPPATEDLGAQHRRPDPGQHRVFRPRYTDDLGVAWKQVKDSEKAFTATTRKSWKITSDRPTRPSRRRARAGSSRSTAPPTTRSRSSSSPTRCWITFSASASSPEARPSRPRRPSERLSRPRRQLHGSARQRIARRTPSRRLPTRTWSSTKSATSACSTPTTSTTARGPASSVSPYWTCW